MRYGITAAVITHTSAYLASDGKRSQWPVPEGMFNDAPRTLDKVARVAKGNRGATVVLQGGRELLRLWQGQSGPISDAGWKVPTHIEPWTTFSKEGEPSLHVCILGAIDADRTPLFHPSDKPWAIAARLAWYDQAIGAPWHMTGGVSGHDAIKTALRTAAKRGGKAPWWGMRDEPRRFDDTRQGSGDLIWQRQPMRAEVALGWVHSYDLNAARLAALGVSEFPADRLEHVGPQAFDPELSGYWQIRAADAPQHKRHPPLFDPADVDRGMVWLTTPTMADMMAAGINPDVLDSWTAEGRRLFRTIAERWDQARKAARDLGDEKLIAAVRATYVEAAGLFARAGGSIYRPEWYHTAMDRQRVTVLNIARRIAKQAGRRPLAIKTDCLWYASDQPDPVRAAEEIGIRLGDGLGAFKVHSTKTAAETFRRKQQ